MAQSLLHHKIFLNDWDTKEHLYRIVTKSFIHQFLFNKVKEDKGGYNNLKL